MAQIIISALVLLPDSFKRGDWNNSYLQIAERPLILVISNHSKPIVLRNNSIVSRNSLQTAKRTLPKTFRTSKHLAVRIYRGIALSELTALLSVTVLTVSKAGSRPHSLKNESYAAMHNHTPAARLRR